MNISFNIFNNYKLQKLTNKTITNPQKISFRGGVDTFEHSSNTKPCFYIGSGNLINKTNKEKVPVDIYMTNDTSTVSTYHFMSKTDKKKKYGYVTLATLKEPQKHKSSYEGTEQKVLDDYPNQGIVGPRVIVDMLENNAKNEITGVGFLADKIGVKHCLDNNIKPPLIISEAMKNSHIAHYKRGKRFLPLEKGSDEYKFFKEKYGTANVNKVISNILKTSNGEKQDISDWPPLIMKLSDEKVNQYIKELKR